MANDPMMNAADAYLNNLIGNESDTDEDIEVLNASPPSDLQNNASSVHSSAAQQFTNFNDNNEIKKQIVIFNLKEPFGNDTIREAADSSTIQQILYAIDASSAVGNVKKISRIGKYNSQGKPRRIVVYFASEDDRKGVLQNASKVNSIPEWKEVDIKAYRPPEPKNDFRNSQQSSQVDYEKEELKQQVAEMKKQMEILMQTQKQQMEHSNSNTAASAPLIPQGHTIQSNQQQNYPPQAHETSPPPNINNNPNFGSQSIVPEQQHFQPANIGYAGMPYQMPQQPQSNGYLPNNFDSSSNGSLVNLQNGNMSQAPMQNSMPFYPNPNMSFDMTAVTAMFQAYLQFVANGNLPNTSTPVSQPQEEVETSSESESEEESSSESEEEEPPAAGIASQNELYKAQSEKHYGTKKVLNILVLGETGVGKSTWINGIANYMSFDTLEDALNASQPICLIASKFAFYETNEDKIEVKLEPSHGEKDENEAFSDQGQSSTQEPKTYQFETSKYIVNIIDTPGIGDTRGIEQDKENTRKILSAIGHYKDLHAICFLFKANEARMTLSFRYCISELLLQLHKDAVDNIIFFFTNARGTFYKPGDTMTPLSQFLTELQQDRGLKISLASDKICCTDNEAFRLVCANFNEADFTKEDFQNFAGSWKQSAAETHRFLEFAARQRPHHVADTVSVNKARTVILHLAKPLADVNELIESNIKVFDDRKKDLQNTAANLDDLKKKLKIPQIGIEVKPLSYPKTVCAAQKCIETQKLPNTEQYQTIYKQICHDHCYLTDVDVEKVPEPHLVGCAAMSGQYCMFCQCHWSTHMHIRFDQIKTTIEIEDKNTKDLIMKNEDASVVKQQIIKHCENTITELKAEQQKIIQTSLRFGSFLQTNAILPYNDAFEKYVEQTISEEEKCTEVGGDRSKLDNLKKLLAEYRQEKALLSEAAKNPTANAGKNITPDEIEVMKKELFVLKNVGKTLENLFKATEDGIKKHNAHVTVKYTPARKPYHYQSKVQSQPQYQKYNKQNNQADKYQKSPKAEKKGKKNKNKNKSKK